MPHYRYDFTHDPERQPRPPWRVQAIVNDGHNGSILNCTHDECRSLRASATRRVEFVPNDRAIYQNDRAKTYQCPWCLHPIFSQYEGDDKPVVLCHGITKGHTLTWT